MKSLHTVLLTFLSLISLSQTSFPCDNEWVKTHPIFINEFLPQDSTTMCWIELGNCDSVPYQLENWFIEITGGVDSTGFFIQGDLLINPGELVAINFYKELWLENISMQIFNDTFGYHTGLVTTSLEINESTGRCDGEPIWQRQVPTIGEINTCQPILTNNIELIGSREMIETKHTNMLGQVVDCLYPGLFTKRVFYSDGTISAQIIFVPH